MHNKSENSPKEKTMDISPNSTQRIDLVFPQHNEKQLVQMALRLNITHLIMCYPLSDPMIKLRQKEVKSHEQENLTIEFAILASNQQDVSKAKSLSNTIVGYARPELFEDKRVTHIIDMEAGRRDDFIHHRNSGLNQVFIQQAIDTDKTLLVNANNLIVENKISRAIILGRMLQNNEFYRKYSPRTIVISGAKEPMQMRPYKDLQVLLRI